jgi:hypothetical protein
VAKIETKPASVAQLQKKIPVNRMKDLEGWMFIHAISSNISVYTIFRATLPTLKRNASEIF